MQPLEISQLNAQRAYNSADAKGKKLLADLFGENVFNQKITDRVKSFDDACAVLGITDPDKIFPEQTHYALLGDQRSIDAYHKLIIIARALNEGWTPDWNNGNQAKWYPWFKMKAGFGFSLTNYDFTGTGTTVGSRLCFKSDELATYAGKQFESIYSDFLTL